MTSPGKRKPIPSFAPSPPPPPVSFDPAAAVKGKGGTPLYLGLEVGRGGACAVLVGEKGGIVGCVEVRLDARALSGEHVLEVVDALLGALAAKHDLGCVVGVGGCAQDALVGLSPRFDEPLDSIRPDRTFAAHFASSSTVEHPFPPVADASPHVVSAAGLLETLLVGHVVGWSAACAAASGLWDARSGRWDGRACAEAGVALDEDAGERGVGGRVRDAGEKGTVSGYLQGRYGFGPECVVVPFLPRSLAGYVSLSPASDDVVLALSDVDTLTFALPHDAPMPDAYSVLPHPMQRVGEARRLVAQITSRNGDAARTQIKAAYANGSWSAFDQMVGVIPPGGSLGFDDKLFLFLWPDPEPHPAGTAHGTTRYEHGFPTAEFADLRANVRCAVEGQFLAFRARHGAAVRALRGGGKRKGRTALDIGFDPFDAQGRAGRVLVEDGPLAESPNVMAVLAEVMGAPVFKADRQDAHLHDATPSAGAIGAAYVARWHTSDPTSPIAASPARLPNSRSPPSSPSTAPSTALATRPTLRPRASRSTLSSAHSALALAAIHEADGGGPAAAGGGALTPVARAQLLVRSKSASLLSPGLARHPPNASNGADFGQAPARAAAAGGGGLVQLARADADGVRAYAGLAAEFARLEELALKRLLV